MKKQIYSMMMATLLTSLMRAASAQNYNWAPVSFRDAQQMVRNFMGEADLQFTSDERDRPLTPQSSTKLTLYELKSGSRYFGISSQTRDFFSFLDLSCADEATFYGQPYDASVLASQAMSRSSAEDIGRAYMLSHYPDPQWLNKMSYTQVDGPRQNPSDPEFVERYTFQFYQEQNGVECPAFFDVTVDTVFGRILAANGMHYPTLVRPVPALTVDQAYACAFNSLHINGGVVGEAKLLVTRPDVLGAERLVYKLQVAAHAISRMQVYVDANDGSILNVDILHSFGGTIKPISPAIRKFMTQRAETPRIPTKNLDCVVGSTKANLNFPPLLVSGHPYLYAGYLIYGISGSKIIRPSPDEVELSGGNERIHFSTHSDSYTVNATTRTLPTKPILIGNACYVPLEAARCVTSLHMQYDSSKKLVNIDPIVASSKPAAISGFGSHLLSPTKPTRTHLPTNAVQVTPNGPLH